MDENKAKRAIRATLALYLVGYLVAVGCFLWPDYKARAECHDRGGEARLGADGIRISCVMGGDKR